MVIYISIPSYMDDDLPNTINNILSNTKNINNIFISIFNQDDKHVDLNNIFNKFNFNNYIYDKINYIDSKGVGYARSMAQKYLTTEFSYFLQIDSHTRFIKDWDEIIIKNYLKSEKRWGNIIYSTYPHGFTIDNGVDNIPNISKSQKLKIVSINKLDRLLPFESKYRDNVDGEFWSGFFCGGFAFGRSRYFLEIPPDPDILFWGEEHLMSIRFYEKKIKIICPEKNYLFHDYDGYLRKRGWETNPNWGNLDAISTKKIKEFFENREPGWWEECFVEQMPIIRPKIAEIGNT